MKTGWHKKKFILLFECIKFGIRLNDSIELAKRDKQRKNCQ